MQWILVERPPDVPVVDGIDTYLGEGDAKTPDATLAVKFETRQKAEAHRRTLTHPYNWVAISAD